MRKLFALVWVASILAMQAHSLVPHHHDELHAVGSGHIEELHHEDVHHLHVIQTGESGEYSHCHDPHEYHEHSETADVRADRILRVQIKSLSLPLAAVSISTENETSGIAKHRHLFLPFKTGPPGSCTSRGPPVPVA